MWPSEESASRAYDLANWGLILSLIVGVASTILIVWMGGVKERYLKLSLAESYERVALAEKGAAEANRIAEQEKLARLQLEAKLADRLLPEDQRLMISESIKPFGKFSLQLIRYSDVTEVRRISDVINSLFIEAGWSVAYAYEISGVVKGIEIAITENATDKAIDAIDVFVTGLRRNNIDVSIKKKSLKEIKMPSGGWGEVGTDAQIWIMIGTK